MWQKPCTKNHLLRYLDFRLRVLKIGNALDEPGTVNWDLALCLLLAWIICYLCVFKGVKSTGKVRGFGKGDILFRVYSSASITSFFKEFFGYKITLNAFSCRTHISLNSQKNIKWFLEGKQNNQLFAVFYNNLSESSRADWSRAMVYESL